MRIVRPDININFMANRKAGFIISAVLLLLSVGSLIVQGGPNYGIDFRGGTLVHVKFDKVAPIVELRSVLEKLRIGDFSIQEFGEPEEVLIRVSQADEGDGGVERSEIVKAALTENFQGNFSIERVEMVGPKVGGDLRQKAMLALIYSLAGILIYITFRFEFRFGIAAIIALAHDAMITLGAFSLMDKEITLTVVAGILTVIGYSLNDTIVVFDRVRENFRLKRGIPIPEVINISINQTLSRTLLTSGTTLFVVLAIFFLGGGVIHDFAFALLVGVLIGTYSSIFVASPALLLWENRKGADKKRNKK